MNFESEFENDELLFQESKAECNIMWKEDETDKKIRNIIRQGIDVLQNDVGTSIDFDNDLQARALLKTYVRYAWNNSQEYFIENNLADILKLEVKYGKN
jgi:hypothetical protein|nr:MAG TPA: Head Tail Connector Protein [Caudoviricetes sp.]